MLLTVVFADRIPVRPPFEQIVSIPYWACDMKNTSLMTLTIIPHNHEIGSAGVRSMVKKVIDIIIDGNTGKISVHLDGYPQEECSQLARKLAGNNTLIPTEGDVRELNRSKKKHSKNEEKVAEKEEVKNE